MFQKIQELIDEKEALVFVLIDEASSVCVSDFEKCLVYRSELLFVVGLCRWRV